MACLFVGQLPFSKFFDADVYDLLEPYGRVLSVRMQHVKGEAFVYFDSVNSADAAIAALHGRRTLKGRQRPLQLFYASSSAEWSWFGILHNTRLHHANHKVELPPFFVKTPPLAGSQWSLVPHVTDEATELVLPATQQAMIAAAEAEQRRGAEAKSTSSSLRTTTSSSSLYSDDSSADSTRQPSRRRGSSASLSSVSSRGQGGAVGFTGGVGAMQRAGTKRPRPLLPHDDDDDDETPRVQRSVASAETASRRAASRRTHARAQRSSSSRGGGINEAGAEEDEEELRGRARRGRSHRKTKLHIEDEENFAVLDIDAQAEEDGAAGGAGEGSGETAQHHHSDETSATTRAGVDVSPTPPPSSAVSSATQTATVRIPAEPQAPAQRTATEASPREAALLPSAAAPTPARALPPPVLLRAADAPFAELPRVLEPSATTTNTTGTASTLSTTLSSAEEADVLGARNVLIRRRRSTRRRGSALEASAPTVTASATAAQTSPAAAARLGWGGMLPQHYHRVTHSCPTSLSPTPTEGTTPNSSLTNAPTQSATSTTTADAPHPVLSASVTSAASADHLARRASRISSPHHHHHHHHIRGAVLSDADLRDVRRTARRSAVLGTAEDASLSMPHTGGDSWGEMNEPLLTSPLTMQQQQQQQRQQSPVSIIPREPAQAEGSGTWVGGGGVQKNSASTAPHRGSGRGWDTRSDR